MNHQNTEAKMKNGSSKIKAKVAEYTEVPPEGSQNVGDVKRYIKDGDIYEKVLKPHKFGLFTDYYQYEYIYRCASRKELGNGLSLWTREEYINTYKVGIRGIYIERTNRNIDQKVYRQGDQTISEGEANKLLMERKKVEQRDNEEAIEIETEASALYHKGKAAESRGDLIKAKEWYQKAYHRYDVKVDSEEARKYLKKILDVPKLIEIAHKSESDYTSKTKSKNQKKISKTTKEAKAEAFYSKGAGAEKGRDLYEARALEHEPKAPYDDRGKRERAETYNSYGIKKGLEGDHSGALEDYKDDALARDPNDQKAKDIKAEAEEATTEIESSMVAASYAEAANKLQNEAATLSGLDSINKLAEAIKQYDFAIQLDTQQKKLYQNKKLELEKQEFEAIISYIELNSQLMDSSTNNLNRAQEGQIGGAKIQNIIKYYKSAYEKCQQSINLGNTEDSKINILQSIAQSGIKIYSLYLEQSENQDLNALNKIIKEIKDFNKLLQENPSLQIPSFLQAMEEVMVKLEEEKTSFEESNAEDNTNININHSGLYPESENISYETNNQQREIGQSIGLHQNIMSIRGVDKYYLDGLNNILKLRILKNHNIDQYNIEIIEAQEVNNNFDVVSLQKIYLSLIKAFTKKNDFILLPIVINFPDKSSMSHAVGIVIKKSSQEVKIKYFDSENQKINPKLKSSIIEIVETINHDIEQSVFFEQIVVEQQQAENCGYEVIENFFNEVFNNRATQNDAILVHNLLYANSLLDTESSTHQIAENDSIIKFLSNQTYKINEFITKVDSDINDELPSIDEANNSFQCMSYNLAITLRTSLNSLGEVELNLLKELEHDKDKAKQILVNLPEYSARVIAEYLDYSETELSNIRNKQNVNIPYANHLNYIDETSPEYKKMIQEIFRFNEQFIYNLNFEYNLETSDDLINSGNQLFSEEIYNAEYQYNYNLVCVVGALALLNKHIF